MRKIFWHLQEENEELQKKLSILQKCVIVVMGKIKKCCMHYLENGKYFLNEVEYLEEENV